MKHTGPKIECEIDLKITFLKMSSDFVIYNII